MPRRLLQSRKVTLDGNQYFSKVSTMSGEELEILGRIWNISFEKEKIFTFRLKMLVRGTTRFEIVEARTPNAFDSSTSNWIIWYF